MPSRRTIVPRRCPAPAGEGKLSGCRHEGAVVTEVLLAIGLLFVFCVLVFGAAIFGALWMRASPGTWRRNGRRSGPPA